jgi:NAD(P)-dependent dehydrogenase (short-subunit alcohol dehydrogenase family)
VDKLDNKVAVVSGAARGQGRSHAVTLAGQGASIIALDICADIEGNTYPLSRSEDLDETARLIEKEGVRVDTIVVDVRDRTAVWKAVADGVAELGRLDVVVANAGICPLGQGQTIQSWTDTVDTDLVGVFNVIQASLPHISDGGSNIATGSLAAPLRNTDNQGRAGALTRSPSRRWPTTSTIYRCNWPNARSGSTQCIRPRSIPTCCIARACTACSGQTWTRLPARTPSWRFRRYCAPVICASPHK